LTLRVTVSDAASTRPLRGRVLRPDDPLDAPMHGDDNPDAVHLAAYDGDQLIGCALILPSPYPLRPDQPGAWQLRGMAVAPERQGSGVGSAVLQTAGAQVRRRGGRLLWCESRRNATGFYAGHGFAAEGAEYPHRETGAPHRMMWRRIEPGPGPVRGRFPAGDGAER
jgi:GNAT superfamily N-acetyltransferase